MGSRSQLIYTRMYQNHIGYGTVPSYEHRAAPIGGRADSRFNSRQITRVMSGDVRVFFVVLTKGSWAAHRTLRSCPGGGWSIYVNIFILRNLLIGSGSIKLDCFVKRNVHCEQQLLAIAHIPGIGSWVEGKGPIIFSSTSFSPDVTQAQTTCAAPPPLNKIWNLHGYYELH